MSIDIEKAKVIGLPDKTGIYNFDDYYSNLAEMAIQSHDDKVKFQFIFKALKRLRTVDKSALPKSESTPFTFQFDIDVDGVTYSKSLEIVKKLNKSVVYELRINLREFNWRFRATFFPQFYDKQLYYCFVYPFEKIPTEPDPTDYYRDLTHEVYMDTRTNSEKYFK